MKNSSFIVLDKREIYTYVAVVAVVVIAVIAFLFNEGMKAGADAEKYYAISETHKAKATYWHDAYVDLSTSGTCLSRLALGEVRD